MLSCSYLLNNKVNANLLNNKLNIAYLNVCGLKSKLLNSDISYMIKKYDILIFVEAKTDEFDENNLPGGFPYHVKHRFFFKRKSGGIIIIYKDTISKCLTFPTSNLNFFSGLKLRTKVHILQNY